jgi:acyl-CoA thioesterase-2
MLTMDHFARCLTLEWISPEQAVAPNLEYYRLTARNAASTAVSDIVAGGQFLAQAIVAAETRKPEMSVLSAHIHFVRTGKVSSQTDVSILEINAGRSFASVQVQFTQSGKPVAHALIQLHVPDDDLIRHSAPMEFVHGVDGRPEDRGAFEFAWPHDVDILDPNEVAPPELPLWVRFKCPRSMPPVMHRALLAFITTFQFVGVAMLPHAGFSAAQSHIGVSSSPMTHQITFHEQPDVSEWLMLEHLVPFAGAGRCHGVGRAFSRDHGLIASFSQDAMLRAIAAPAAAADGRRPL